jgi:hypothetical protein
LLSLVIAAYAAYHTMASVQATAMLGELILMLFAMCCSLAALSVRSRAKAPAEPAALARGIASARAGAACPMG